MTEAVRTLGWVPNPIAGSLASVGSRLVGAAIPPLSNTGFPEVFRRIKAGLAGTNRQSVSSGTDFDPDKKSLCCAACWLGNTATVRIAGAAHTDATRRTLDQIGIHIIDFMKIDHSPIDFTKAAIHSGKSIAGARAKKPRCHAGNNSLTLRICGFGASQPCYTPSNCAASA